MATYVIKTDDKFNRKAAEKALKKVGKGRSLYDIIVVETEKSKEELEKMPGVVQVEEDVQAELDSWPSQYNPDPNDTNSFYTVTTAYDGTEQVYNQSSSGYGLAHLSGQADDFQFLGRGENVDIFIIDTGLNPSQAEFGGRAMSAYSHDGQSHDFTESTGYHGTAVASCAAGEKWGVAKKANIKSCRTTFWYSDLVKIYDGILYHHVNKADNNPTVVNMSYSFSYESQIAKPIFEQMFNAGIVLVASASNNNQEVARWPAADAHVLSVGASDATKGKAWFSNYGSYVSVWAPGNAVDSKGTSNEDIKISGTSFSAPYTAGCIATLLTGSQKLVNATEMIALDTYLNDHVWTHEFDNTLAPNSTTRFARNWGRYAYENSMPLKP